MSSGDESYAEYLYMDILEYIFDGSQSNPSIKRRELIYKIHRF